MNPDTFCHFKVLEEDTIPISFYAGAFPSPASWYNLKESHFEQVYLLINLLFLLLKICHFPNEL